ncbi:MAG: hypothetical protein ACI9ND_001340 [Yoonia sp.]|jgi:hypothetical protein
MVSARAPSTASKLNAFGYIFLIGSLKEPPQKKKLP